MINAQETDLKVQLCEREPARSRWLICSAVLTVASLLANLTILIIFIYLSVPHNDDWVRAVLYLIDTKDQLAAGFSEYMHWLYYNWSGRWASIGIAAWVFPKVDMIRVYPWMVVALFCFHWLALSLLYWRLRGLHKRLSGVDILFGGVSLIMLWACMPNHGSNFYWVTGSLENQLSVSLMVILFVALTSSSWTTCSLPARGICLFIVSVMIIFVTGMHELFSMAFLMAIFVGALIAIKTRSGSLLVWCVAIVSSLIGCWICIDAPGNEVRFQSFPPAYISQRHQISSTLFGVFKGVWNEMSAWLLDPKLLLSIVVAWSLGSFRGNSWIERHRHVLRLAVPTATIGIVLASVAAVHWSLGHSYELPARTWGGLYTIFFIGAICSAFLFSPQLLTRRPNGSGLTYELPAISCLLSIALITTGSFRVGFEDIVRDGAFKWHAQVDRLYEVARRGQASGVLDLKVELPSGLPTMLAVTNLRDAKDNYYNVSFSAYFGLRSIVGVPSLKAD